MVEHKTCMWFQMKHFFMNDTRQAMINVQDHKAQNVLNLVKLLLLGKMITGAQNQTSFNLSINLFSIK